MSELGDGQAIENLPAEYELALEQVKALKINSPADYQTMASAVLLCKKAVSYFEELYRPRIRQADAVTSGLRSDMRKLQEPFVKTSDYGNSELLRWRREEDERARERAAAEAKEQREKDELERKQLAEIAESAGEDELAEEIRNAPRTDPIVAPQPNTPKVAGLSFRQDWKFQITDEKLIPREYLSIDEVKIGKVVRAMKEATNIPGVRAYSVDVPVGTKS